MRSRFFFWTVVVLCTSCTSRKISNDKITAIKFLDQTEIAYGTKFNQTELGGFSGIDYDKTKDEYYIICDDRSERNPARFYKAKIEIADKKIREFKIVEVEFLKNEAGDYFESYRKNPKKSTDPEDIRYNPKTQKIYWTSEGERLLKNNDTILLQPSLWAANLDGSFSKAFELPKELEISSQESGPRRNGVLEGLSFNQNFTKIYTQVEEPLYQDGAQANLNKGGKIRLFEFDTKTRKNTAQYFYDIDAIDKEPIPKDGFAINGVSAILKLKNGFVFVERSYSVGNEQNTIKLYYQEYNKQNNILLPNPEKNPEKVLLINLNSLGIKIDNIEGITLGPQLENHKRALLLVSDNNFSSDQKTQLLLFEIPNNF